MGEHSPKPRGEAVGNRFEVGRLSGGVQPVRERPARSQQSRFEKSSPRSSRVLPNGWLTALTRIVTGARNGSAVIVRDWTFYSYGMALLPLSIIPAIPLWHMLDAMDLDEAVITASTLSFAGHYLIAHFVLYEMIGRRAISTPRSPAFVRKAG